MFRHCVTDCRPVPGGGGSGRHHDPNHRHVLEYQLVALPSGISADHDLLRLLVLDQNDHIVTRSTFNLVLDDDTTVNAPFNIRTEDGRGVVFTTRALPDNQSYQLKVEGVAYDSPGIVVLYHTTFIVHISVASYPY